MKNRIADEVRLKHILDAISDIVEFTFDKDFAEFNVDKMMHLPVSINWK